MDRRFKGPYVKPDSPLRYYPTSTRIIRTATGNLLNPRVDNSVHAVWIGYSLHRCWLTRVVQQPGTDLERRVRVRAPTRPALSRSLELAALINS